MGVTLDTLERAGPGPCPSVLRETLRSFATGVVVVTTRTATSAICGLTINSFTSVSLDPPLVLWNLQRNSPLLDVFVSAGSFGVNVPAEDQAHLSKQFSSPIADRFCGVDVEIGHLGVPLIAAASAHFECNLAATYEGGDHVIILGNVASCRSSGRKPLVFALGEYRRLVIEGDHDREALISSASREQSDPRDGSLNERDHPPKVTS